MLIEDFILYMVENYVSSHLEGLYEEQKVCSFDKQREEDINFLENLTTDDYIKISDLAFDEEVRDKLFSNIDYYLWRHQNDK